MFRAARGTRPGVLRSLHGNATLWAGSSGSSLAAQATPTADTTVTASAHSAKRRTTSLRACRFMSPSPFTDTGPAAGSGGPLVRRQRSGAQTSVTGPSHSSYSVQNGAVAEASDRSFVTARRASMRPCPKHSSYPARPISTTLDITRSATALGDDLTSPFPLNLPIWLTTSAATPAAWGEAIDVPCRHP